MIFASSTHLTSVQHHPSAAIVNCVFSICEEVGYFVSGLNGFLFVSIAIRATKISLVRKCEIFRPCRDFQPRIYILLQPTNCDLRSRSSFSHYDGVENSREKISKCFKERSAPSFVVVLLERLSRLHIDVETLNIGFQ